MPQCFASMHGDIVFSTKGRARLITPELESRLHPYLGGILRAEDSPLVAVGGMPDHVHLLVSLSRERSLAEIVRVVKANSSKWIHETFHDRRALAWQAGYGTFAVSFSNVQSVKRYIDNQAEHHRQMTFQDEFVALLRRHRVPFDEGYLSD
jgi:putative transposase